MTFQSDVKKLGLSDKEAAVYLASLGLGPSSVQQISRKARVARATTYLVLDALIEKKLVSKYTEGEKTVFVAEDPYHLQHLLEKREAEIREEKQELAQLMPKLQAFMRAADDRPVVRYYSGIEGLKAMRAEMAMYSNSKDEWYNFTPIDYLHALFGEAEIDYTPRRAKGIRQKTIFTTKSSETKARVFKKERRGYNENKFVSPRRYTSPCGFTVFKDRVAVGTFKGNLGGMIIESGAVAQMMKEFFELTWNSLD